MNQNDSLQQLLVDFFNLPPDSRAEDLTQQAIPAWDSLAMVQLIAELQSAFGVKFDVDEIEHLGSYAQMRSALTAKGIQFSEGDAGTAGISK
jgi:acyl carrier protein